jgi:hypothetical protein
MEPDYEYAELRVSYPGHPRIALIDGIDLSGNLKRIWCVADQFFHGRERIGERQQLMFRLPAAPKIWEVTERIGERTRYRYITVIGGSLRRIDYQSVVSVLRGKMRLAEAVRLCGGMDIGPDYEEIGVDEESSVEPLRSNVSTTELIVDNVGSEDGEAL